MIRSDLVEANVNIIPSINFIHFFSISNKSFMRFSVEFSLHTFIHNPTEEINFHYLHIHTTDFYLFVKGFQIISITNANSTVNNAYYQIVFNLSKLLGEINLGLIKKQRRISYAYCSFADQNIAYIDRHLDE